MMVKGSTCLDTLIHLKQINSFENAVRRKTNIMFSIINLPSLRDDVSVKRDPRTTHKNLYNLDTKQFLWEENVTPALQINVSKQ